MLIQQCPLGDRYPAHVEDDLLTAHPREPIGCEVIRPLLWDHDEVRVVDAIPVHQISDAFQRKYATHPSPEMLCNDDDSLRDIIREVGEVIDVHLRDDEALTWCRGLQRHERGNDLVFVDEARRRATRDDIAEDAAHAVRDQNVRPDWSNLRC